MSIRSMSSVKYLSCCYIEKNNDNRRKHNLIYCKAIQWKRFKMLFYRRNQKRKPIFQQLLYFFIYIHRINDMIQRIIFNLISYLFIFYMRKVKQEICQFYNNVPILFLLFLIKRLLCMKISNIKLKSSCQFLNFQKLVKCIQHTTFFV